MVAVHPNALCKDSDSVQTCTSWVDDSALKVHCKAQLVNNDIISNQIKCDILLGLFIRCLKTIVQYFNHFFRLIEFYKLYWQGKKWRVVYVLPIYNVREPGLISNLYNQTCFMQPWKYSILGGWMWRQWRHWQWWYISLLTAFAIEVAWRIMSSCREQITH